MLWVYPGGESPKRSESTVALLISRGRDRALILVSALKPCPASDTFGRMPLE